MAAPDEIPTMHQEQSRTGLLLPSLTEAHHLMHNLEHSGCKISLQLSINQSTDVTEQNSKGTFNAS